MADTELLRKLEELGRALDPFTVGILTGSLSVEQQLYFGWKLIDIAELIRRRTSPDSIDNGRPAVDGDVL